VTATSRTPLVRAALDRIRRASGLALLLDYDGTLVELTAIPDQAVPDPRLLDLLRRLCARPGTEVNLVSGRKRATLERWFSGLPAGLYAEHGLWSRPPSGEWTAAEIPPDSWRAPVLALLRDFTDRTPGSLVEEKTAGFAWLFRGADPAWGEVQAGELAARLSTLLARAPLEILSGEKVLEVRPRGIDKGRAVAEVVAHNPPGTLLVALGDDRTDEDLFAALPPDAIAMHVGPAPSRAPLRLPDVAAARALLEEIAGGRG
jgi:trehalose 6-phosphate synthase/phosphatase